ncbi:MAG: hypothetical protein JXN59_13305 [Anaerolineae bacterium]|nr:hypothetical protein [Anaerolineae bacterium]
MTPDEHPPRAGSLNSRIALVVILFGALSLVLVLLANGGGIPESLNIQATNTVRTLVAEAALRPPAPVRWTFYELGRRKPVHDLIWQEGTLWVASVDGLLRLTAEGEFEPVPGFPAGAVPVRLWEAEGVLWAGLEDGQSAIYRDGAWEPPTSVALLIPPLLGAIPQGELAPGLTLDAICMPLGSSTAAAGSLTATSSPNAAAGSLWLACPESIVHVQAGEVRRYTSVDGLPDTPTGPLVEGPDGRLWIGLETGVAALEELGAE